MLIFIQIISAEYLFLSVCLVGNNYVNYSILIDRAQIY